MQTPVFLPPPRDGQPALLRSESLAAWPAPVLLSPVDDWLTADAAIQRTQRGELLLYVGDYRNARQLLSAMGRRLTRGRRPPTGPSEIYRAERDLRARAHAVLSRILIAIDAEGAVACKHAPNVAEAVALALGPRAGWSVVPLTELLGMIGAAQWRKKGVAVPGLSLPLLTAYGVFPPTRAEPALLVAKIPDPTGRRVLDVGTGTGILALLLLARGAAQAVATDADARAVACAHENAARLGCGDRLVAVEADLFSPGRFDLVVANPPWVPQEAKTRLDRAIFDPGGTFLSGYLAGLADHLVPDGLGYLILSDFAELLGLRAVGALAATAAAAGLALREVAGLSAVHPKAQDRADPLHAFRSRERVSLFELRVAKASAH